MCFLPYTCCHCEENQHSELTQLLHLSLLWQHLWACSGNERARGQASWVHPWSRGQGACKEGQRIYRPEMNTKKDINYKLHCQRSLSAPIPANKIVLCSKNPAELRQSRGNILRSTAFTGKRLKRRSGFFQAVKKRW